MNIVEVKHENNKNTFFYRNSFSKVKVNYNVIVNSSRGLLFGKVVNIIEDSDCFNEASIYDVVRIASKRDFYQHLDNLKRIDSDIDKCKKIVEKYELPMSIFDGSYNFDRSQLMFRFVSEERVDFRQLAKELGSVFRTRIELRQVGIRDKAKEIGSIGPCGRIICCSSFLKSFDSVTISMAKNQSVSLNPTKINGVCGRLLCCLRYENEVYNDYKNKLPKVGEVVNYGKYSGKVIDIDILMGKVRLELKDKKIMDVDYNGS